MKRAFLLASITIVVFLASSSVNLAVNSRPFLNQHTSVSEDTRKTNPLPILGKMAPNSRDEPGLTGENRTIKERTEAHNETLTGDDNADAPSNENPVQSGIEESSAGSIQSPVVPLPDGRIFYRGEPPYGYLPTSYPKQNIRLPPIFLDVDS